jgi:hypothetical protein
VRRHSAKPAASTSPPPKKLRSTTWAMDAKVERAAWGRSSSRPISREVSAGRTSRGLRPWISSMLRCRISRTASA